MRAMVLTDLRRIDARDLTLPELGPRDALVRVAVTGVCGSDLAVWRGTHPYKRPPTTLGHELSGVVVRFGDAVTSVRLGDRVCASSFGWCGTCAACTTGRPNLCAVKVNLSHGGYPGSFAEYVVLRDEMMFVLPPGVDDARGALVEPVSIAVRALRLAEGRARCSLLVLGAGSIGLACCLVARQSGYERIVATELDPAKARRADACGVDAFVDARDDVVARARAALGGGADVTLVASGHPTALREAIGATRPGGLVVVIAYFSGPVDVPFDALVRAEVAVQGSSLATPEDVAVALEWIGSGALDPLPLVTHHLALEDAARALEMVDYPAPGQGKVLLHPAWPPGNVVHVA